MRHQFKKIFQKTYPQSFIFRKPVLGTILYGFVIFLFLILYKPLNVRQAQNFNLVNTMFLYQIFATVLIMILAVVINRTNCFSKNKEWTFLKEIISDLVIATGFGIVIYFLGFLIEEPSNRWNLPTFFDAFLRASLIGIIPLLFFTLSNIRHLYATDVMQVFKSEQQTSHEQPKEELIQIISKLKKEELNFYPHEFIYAESEGNYVVFHLNDSEKFKKVMIRNSISNIEEQLSGIPIFMRTHRAFIVNVKKVASKKGNSLGYRLKFAGIETEIPVSRQNIQTFDELIRQFR